VCTFAPSCGTDGKHGCACTTAGECDNGQFCVKDDDTGAGFCSTCDVCTASAACDNPCSCGEICFGGFTQPDSLCGGGGGPTPTCPNNATACPNGVGDCNASLNETCLNGCCFATCAVGVTPCTISSDCPTGTLYICVTGCCIQSF